MEWTIAALGGVGAVYLHAAFPGRWWRIFIAGYGLGLAFEGMMEPLFTYHPQLRDRHCVGGCDLNFLLPLGWIEIAGGTALLARFIPTPHVLLSYMAAAFLVGNLHEFLFYRFGFWRYNYDRPMIGSYRPLMPKVTVAGVPVQVIVGYCNVGIMAYVLCRFIIKGC